MQEMTYKEQLEQELKDLTARVQAGIAARGLMESAEGELIQEWINLRITLLMDKITSNKPVSEAEYLSAHGGIRELKDFNVMLVTKVTLAKDAEEQQAEVRNALKDL